jgi:hypothetical protein
MVSVSTMAMATVIVEEHDNGNTVRFVPLGLGYLFSPITDAQRGVSEWD